MLLWDELNFSGCGGHWDGDLHRSHCPGSLKHRNGNGESRDVRWDAPWLVPAEVALLVGTAATHKQHRPVVSGCGSGAVLVKLTHDG